ncbi:GIY-YIG nuclease family protein [Methanobrevibacter sp. UBA313]|jgi:Uri superfamily endonuclease|uniref:GIY-YIG nuclease family protein n=1 Tax=Methanobrevibacter sp. UBA313 TaxID=1915477 RepID=UPI0039B8F608
MTLKGSYCLIIHLKKNEIIKVGNLYSKLKLNKGYYVYIGSAMNSLIPRINRHLSQEKKLHWHIDYLLKNKNTEIEEVLFNISNNKIECKLAKKISEKGEEITKFGCSDCECNSHLIYFKNYEDANENIKKAFNYLNMNYHNLNYFKNKLQ